MGTARETSQRQSSGVSLTAVQDGGLEDNAVADHEQTHADSSPQKTRKRIRHFTSGDRAAHRVFERARREAFREKLVELAELLPTLRDADASRLSKHTVVHESIARHHQQQQQIDALTRERDALQAEVARWRVQAEQVENVENAAVVSPSLAAPPALPLRMPNDDTATQLPAATAPPDLGLLSPELMLPLNEGAQLSSAPESSWPWDADFDLHAEVVGIEVPASWADLGDALDDADIGRLVVSSMVPRSDAQCQLGDATVVNAAGLNNGLLNAAERHMGQMLWMVPP